MICSTCCVPMATIPGSESGTMNDEYYRTEEVKICPQCGKRVRETYEAKIEIEPVTYPHYANKKN